MKNLIFGYFSKRKTVEKIKVLLKSDNINGHFTWRIWYLGIFRKKKLLRKLRFY